MTIEELYDKAIKVYTAKHQMYKCIEECGELTTALLHFQDFRVSCDEVISEVADVMIMCEQMAMIFGRRKVEAERQRKLDRLEARLLVKMNTQREDELGAG